MRFTLKSRACCVSALVRRKKGCINSEIDYFKLLLLTKPNYSMITTLRRIVYFGGLFITLMAIILIMIKNDIGYIPEYLSVFMLSLIFVMGGLLIFLIAKRGLGG